ncbi:MAG: molybdopterin-dependent oxidoreductase [Rhizobiales bacterium]|nr:molybdopterin-dependent oxidoreductase [Hyphomicrobiales bacterium]
MTKPLRIGHSACPHDCPSTCALDIDVMPDGLIGRVRGARDNTYTDGVICAKVARYAERANHPDRLLHPLRRVGPKGAGQFERCSWDEALDRVAEGLIEAERRHGSEAVWPYFYAGTMGLLQRDGIHRLRHAKRYSRQGETICIALPVAGWVVGHGKRRGVDPREMAKSDVIVLWGTNAVHTQVNVMAHATRARKERGARIVAVDIYRNATLEQAELPLVIRPGTDAALACGVLHILFRDGHADREYLWRYASGTDELEDHVRSRTPEWAAAITGLSVDEIEAFARLVGEHPRTLLRLGYGFSRSRNGAMSMHAACCIPVVTGAWQHEGGGALQSNSAIYDIDKSLIVGRELLDRTTRIIDMSCIGPALTGDAIALDGGGPVSALFIQNTNPVSVAPDQRLVKRGISRDDLFVAVHEQFMTETARYADVVLPAAMFTEYEDIYISSGQTHLLAGPKLVDPPAECRSNHWVIRELAARLGIADAHEGFRLEAPEILDRTLRASGFPGWSELVERRWIDCALPFEKAHFLDGFETSDGRFQFAADWAGLQARSERPVGDASTMPRLPDYWRITEAADARHPFRLATSPARNFLNSTFTETPTSRAREGGPKVLVHPSDLASLGAHDGQRLRLGNARGEVIVTAKAFDGVLPGVLIVESITPNDHFEAGEGINTLTGADPAPPVGGAAFHDNAVWARPVQSEDEATPRRDESESAGHVVA